MKGPLRWALFAWFLALNQPIDAQEPSKFEKIRDTSPDGKFAVRISCSSEPEDPNNIDSSLITGVELISLSSKKIVMDLQNYDGSAARVIWSPDSNWLAFSSSSGPRVSDTYVYHRSGDDFSEFKTENLQVDVKGDVRNEYVRPIRWAKPGVLLPKKPASSRSFRKSELHQDCHMAMTDKKPQTVIDHIMDSVLLEE